MDEINSAASANRQRRLVELAPAREILDRALEESGLGPRFHMTRCADEAHSKPHPQMLVDIMQRLDVRPGQTIMVGDTEYDMAMATNAGAGKVAVTTGVHTQERLAQHAPMVTLQKLAEMPMWMAEAGLITR